MHTCSTHVHNGHSVYKCTHVPNGYMDSTLSQTPVLYISPVSVIVYGFLGTVFTGYFEVVIVGLSQTPIRFYKFVW